LTQEIMIIYCEHLDSDDCQCHPKYLQLQFSRKSAVQFLKIRLGFYYEISAIIHHVYFDLEIGASVMFPYTAIPKFKRIFPYDKMYQLGPTKRVSIFL